MEENRKFPVKWIWGLFFLHLASCLLLFGQLPPFVGSWYPWARRAVSLGIVVCLYLLPGRYRLAAMAKALGLLCSLVSLAFYRVLYLFGVQLDAEGYALANTLLARASDILALMAPFLEYTAHADTVPEDKRKWYILLACSLGVTLVSYVAFALLQPMLAELNVVFIRLWNLGARALSLAVSAAYLVLLYRTIQAVKNKEET